MSTQAAERGAPDEVVTHARVRVVDLPLDAGRMALITLDNDRDHTRPSTFGPGGIASLDAALDQIADMTGIVAVGITGKPLVFAVGADLSAMTGVEDANVVREFAQYGHNVMRRFGEMDVPTFAFVNGAAMGGGLEVALHCDYRTVSSSAAAVSLPEVLLGLIPGWGGAWLLPNLIGPAPALQVIVSNPLAQNKQLKPAEAVKLGIFDAEFEAADFLEESMRWAAKVVRGDIAVQRAPIDRDSWDAVVDAAQAQLDAQLHGASASATNAIALIRAAKAATRDEGFAAEDEALTSLVMSDPTRACLYSFDLVQRRAKKPAGAPDKSLARPVNKVGIVGAGLMASQLALLFARRLEVPIVITDLDQERIDKGLAYVRNDLAAQVAKGRMSQDKANRLSALVTGSVSKEPFADADFVLEAVYENLDVKRRLFAELEGIVSETCILATNTSSLSVTAMAEGLKHPERVVGFHFFNPVAVMPLLEIARAASTDDATLATAFAVGKSLKKSCVLVADAPAFVVNRLLTRFLGELIAAFDEGTDLEVVDRAMDPLGLPMSPFTLLGLVGPAVSFHVSETMHAAFPDRYGVSDNMRKVVEAGKGAVWVWDDKGNRTMDPELAAVFQQGDVQLTEEQVRARVLAAVADEARRMLDEGVVAEAQDLDLCMLLGAGWPFWLGGITPYLDRTGTSEQATGRRFLPAGVASV